MVILTSALKLEKLKGSHGRQVMWSTIPVKYSHLFKIVGF